MFIPAVFNGIIEMVATASLQAQLCLCVYAAMWFAIALGLSLRVQDVPE